MPPCTRAFALSRASRQWHTIASPIVTTRLESPDDNNHVSDASPSRPLKNLAPQNATTDTVNSEVVNRSVIRRVFSPSRTPEASPSLAMKTAFQQTNMPWSVPPDYANKLDLSYYAATKLYNHFDKKRQGLQSIPLESRSRSSLHSILAAYTRAAAVMDDSDMRAGSKMASCQLQDEDNALLRRKGYTLNDVRIWYSILSCEDSIEAVQRLQATAHHGTAIDSSPRTPVPIFVIMFLLRRPTLHADALENLLAYLWERADAPATMSTSGKGPAAKISPTSESSARLTDPKTLLLMCIRLLRHARMVLPQAFLTVVRLYIHCWQSRAPWILDPNGVQSRAAPKVVREHNVLLVLLSLPSSVNPYLSTTFQETAQFDLLGHMAEQRPTISVNRQGYRAIVRVQLARKKTPQEQDWARLKMPTWPPWKEDKIGFDSEKGTEYGTSRALTALKHARAAGYGDRGWDLVARITSGWDTDHSPTIQTRMWLMHRKLSQRGPGHQTGISKHAFWAARIRSTRTAHESWALFLSYKARFRRPKNQVIAALIEKLAAEDQRQATERHELFDSYGNDRSPARLRQEGEYPEVLAPPQSEREGVVTSTPVPLMDGFAEDMKNQYGFVPGVETLIVMIKNAQSFEYAQKYLEWASVRRPALQALLGLSMDTFDAPQTAPKDVHPRLYRAYLDRCFYRLRLSSPLEDDVTARLERWKHILAYIRRTLDMARPSKPGRPVEWFPIFKALSDYRISVGNAQQSVASVSWAYLMQARRTMSDRRVLETHFTLQATFRGAMNVIFEKQEIESRGLPVAMVQDPVSRPVHLKDANELRNSASSLSRQAFYAFLGGRGPGRWQGLHRDQNTNRDVHVDWPALLAKPTGPVILDYIRVQGLAGKHENLLEVAQWMFQHRQAIGAAAEEARSGRVKLRRCILSLRAFLERSWLVYFHRSSEVVLPATAAPEEVLLQVRKVVEEGKEVWGDWPSDEEVKEVLDTELIWSHIQKTRCL